MKSISLCRAAASAPLRYSSSALRVNMTRMCGRSFKWIRRLQNIKAYVHSKGVEADPQSADGRLNKSTAESVHILKNLLEVDDL